MIIGAVVQISAASAQSRFDDLRAEGIFPFADVDAQVTVPVVKTAHDAQELISPGNPPIAFMVVPEGNFNASMHLAGLLSLECGLACTAAEILETNAGLYSWLRTIAPEIPSADERAPFWVIYQPQQPQVGGASAQHMVLRSGDATDLNAEAGGRLQPVHELAESWLIDHVFYGVEGSQPGTYLPVFVPVTAPHVRKEGLAKLIAQQPAGSANDILAVLYRTDVPNKVVHDEWPARLLEGVEQVKYWGLQVPPSLRAVVEINCATDASVCEALLGRGAPEDHAVFVLIRPDKGYVNEYTGPPTETALQSWLTAQGVPGPNADATCVRDWAVKQIRLPAPGPTAGAAAGKLAALPVALSP